MLSKRDVYSMAFAAIVMAAGLSVAFAQDTGAQEPPPPPAEDGAAVDVQRRADLTPAEQVEEAQRIQQRAMTTRTRLMNMLDTARRERDIIRVTCLDDKLTQLNANLTTLDRRIESLQDAIERSDEGSRNHEFTVIAVLDQKFQVLEQEANQCVGQDIFETGATRVVTDVEEGTPEGDATDVPQVMSEPLPFLPAAASPST